jgi:hypothetical protein
MILAASILLSLAAFSLIAGPSIDMVKMGKKAGYEMIVNYLANAEPTSLVH